MLLDFVQVQYQCSQRGVVCIRKVVDKSMQGITALDIIIDACHAVSDDSPELNIR